MAVEVPASLPLHVLSVADVDAMVAAGILREDDRVELLEGALVEMSPQSEAHAYAIRRLNALAVPVAAAAGLEVAVQVPLALPSAISRPEPDLAITPPAPRDHHSSDAVLAIEVAASSKPIDLTLKARIYAAAGVPEYWVLDIEARELVVHRTPGADGYRQITRLDERATVTAERVALTVALAAVL